MNLNYLRNQKGFVALISVIIIFAILMVLAALIATSSFFTRFNVLDYENKKVSVGLAEGCAETALVNLAKDTNYRPADLLHGDLITIDTGKTCKICGVQTSGSQKIIMARALYNQAYTDLVVKVTPIVGNFQVDYWDEEPPFNVGYNWSDCNLP